MRQCGRGASGNTRPCQGLVEGSIPSARSKNKRNWYSGCASAFQADETGSFPVFRSNYGVLSVVVCTSRCDRDSMGSIPIEYPNMSLR
jgi:hypothetical protein